MKPKVVTRIGHTLSRRPLFLSLQSCVSSEMVLVDTDFGAFDIWIESDGDRLDEYASTSNSNKWDCFVPSEEDKVRSSCFGQKGGPKRCLTCAILDFFHRLFVQRARCWCSSLSLCRWRAGGIQGQLQGCQTPRQDWRGKRVGWNAASVGCLHPYTSSSPLTPTVVLSFVFSRLRLQGNSPLKVRLEWITQSATDQFTEDNDSADLGSLSRLGTICVTVEQGTIGSSLKPSYKKISLPGDEVVSEKSKKAGTHIIRCAYGPMFLSL